MRDPLTAEAQRQLQELREEYEWAEQYLHHQYEGMQRALVDLYRRKVAGVATQQQALNASSPAAVLGAAADSLHKEDAPAPTASHDVHPRSVLPLSDTARDALECGVDIEPEQPTVKRAAPRSEGNHGDPLLEAWKHEWNFHYCRVHAPGGSKQVQSVTQHRRLPASLWEKVGLSPPSYSKTPADSYMDGRQCPDYIGIVTSLTASDVDPSLESPSGWEAKLKEKTANGELQDSVKAYLSTFTRGRRFNTQSSDDLSDEDDDDDFMLTAAQSDSDTAMDNATNAYPDEPDDPILPLYNQDEEGYTETDTSIQSGHDGGASESGDSTAADGVHGRPNALAERKLQWKKLQEAWLAVLDVTGSSTPYETEAKSLALKQLCSLFEADYRKVEDYEAVPITLNEHLALQKEMRLAWVMAVIAACVRKQAQKVVRISIPKIDRKAHSIWTKGVRNGRADAWKETSQKLADRLLKVVEEVAVSNVRSRSRQVLKTRCKATEVTVHDLLIMRRQLEICQMNTCPDRLPKGGKETTPKHPNSADNKEEDDTGALAGYEASDYESSFIDDTEDVVGDEIEVMAGRETLVNRQFLVGGASARQKGLSNKRALEDEGGQQQAKKPRAAGKKVSADDVQGDMPSTEQTVPSDEGGTDSIQDNSEIEHTGGSKHSMKGNSTLEAGKEVELGHGTTAWLSQYTLVSMCSKEETANILQQNVPSEVEKEIQTVEACRIRPVPEHSTPIFVPGRLLEVLFPQQDAMHGDGYPAEGLKWQLCLIMASSKSVHDCPAPQPDMPEGSSSLLKRLYSQRQPENAGPSDGMSNLKLYNYSNQQIVHLSGADLACSKFRQAMTWDERSGHWRARDMDSVPPIKPAAWKKLGRERDEIILERLQAALVEQQQKGQDKTQSMPTLRKMFFRVAARDPDASEYKKVVNFFKDNGWPLQDAAPSRNATSSRSGRKLAGAWQGTRTGRSREESSAERQEITPQDAAAERRKTKRDALESKKAKAAQLKAKGRIIGQSSQTPTKMPVDGVPLFPDMPNSPTVLATVASKLKSYQWDGVRFIWENLVQEHEAWEGAGAQDDDDVPGGCVLAHSMGLGKTLQTITFLHTFHVHRPGTKSLIVLPKNVLANWKQEFHTWLGSNKGTHVYVVSTATNVLETIRQWSQQPGGVLLMTYSKLANLMLPKAGKETTEKQRDLDNEMRDLLMHTPDIIVADEAHELRTTSSQKHKAIKKVKTKRRLALTGYPLQNNLNEYYVMICWVRPDYLGNAEEFKYDFAQPINEGQWSTDLDARAIMLDQLSVLDDMTTGFIQRKGLSFLEEELAKIDVRRTEHVLFLRLSEAQEKLYQAYLESVSRRSLMSDSENLRKICNAPETFLQKLRQMREVASQDGSWVTDDVCDLTLDEEPAADAPGGKQVKATISAKVAEKLLQIAEEGQELENPKLAVLDKMLDDSRASKEQLVIFSESVVMLDHLESHMNTKGWRMAPTQLEDNGETYYLRLDGKTQSEKRQLDVNRFKKDSKLILVYLMSTKAGSLGINLTSAARMVILDCPWNPVHNAQGVARIFRLGQLRSSNIYRLVYENTMEHRIYSCTLGKESLAFSVVDRKPTIPQSKEKEMYKYIRPTPLEKTRLMEAANKTGNAMLKSICSSSDSVMSINDHQALLATDMDHQLDTHDRKGAAHRYLQRFEQKDSADVMWGGQPLIAGAAPRRLTRLRKKRNIEEEMHKRMAALAEGGNIGGPLGSGPSAGAAVLPVGTEAETGPSGPSGGLSASVPAPGSGLPNAEGAGHPQAPGAAEATSMAPTPAHEPARGEDLVQNVPASGLTARAPLAAKLEEEDRDAANVGVLPGSEERQAEGANGSDDDEIIIISDSDE